MSSEQVKSSRQEGKASSKAELYASIESLLPWARIEIECLESYVQDFPDNPEHTTDAERVRQGLAALAMAERLIARKTGVMCRKQRALKEAANG